MAVLPVFRVRYPWDGWWVVGGLIASERTMVARCWGRGCTTQNLTRLDWLI